MKRCLICLTLFALLFSRASAEGSYTSYIQDAWGDSVPAPDSYLPVRALNGLKETGKRFTKPSDVFVRDDEIIYLSDSGNNRVVVMDGELGFVREITGFTDSSGALVSLKNPTGLFADGQGLLYICLPDEGRVIVLNEQDCLVAEYGRPDSDLLEENAEFKPDKVLANRLGTVFILPKGMYLGAVMYDRQGNFLGFYGANDVAVSVGVMMDYMWKQILSQEQVGSMARYVPVQFASFDIDGENFIYTCTNENNTYREISKLNSLGDNVLISHTRNVVSQTGNYGDIERGYYMGQTQDSRFVDLCVHENGIFYALDRTRGRVFVYDPESHLLCVFGGTGYQTGVFQSPAAIDTIGQTVLVLDADTGLLTAFERTEYGELVESAVLRYIDGRYGDARALWEEVARRNVNCELAYIGIGKALYEEGDYVDAMHYFELGYDREGYSRAWDEYRKQTGRDVLPAVFTSVAALALALAAFAAVRRRKGRRDEP